MMQAVIRVQQSLGLIRGVILGRHRRRLFSEAEARAMVIKRLRGWEWLPLPALSLVTSILVEALLLKPRRLSRSPRSGASIGTEGIRIGTPTLVCQSSDRSPWLRSVKSSEMEAPGVSPSLRLRMRSLWLSPRQSLNTCLAIQTGQEARLAVVITNP